MIHKPNWFLGSRPRGNGLCGDTHEICLTLLKERCERGGLGTSAVYLVRRLEWLGFTGQVARIHGGMDFRECEVQIEFFRKPTNEGGSLYVACTDAAGEGLNMQFAWRLLVFFSHRRRRADRKRVAQGVQPARAILALCRLRLCHPPSPVTAGLSPFW